MLGFLIKRRRKPVHLYHHLCSVLVLPMTILIITVIIISNSTTNNTITTTTNKHIIHEGPRTDIVPRVQQEKVVAKKVDSTLPYERRFAQVSDVENEGHVDGDVDVERDGGETK